MKSHALKCSTEMQWAYVRGGGFPPLFMECVIRLPWSALRERPNIKTVRTPARTRNTAPMASAFEVPKPEFSSGGATIFVGTATTGATRLAGGATAAFVGFVATTGNGKFVSPFAMTLVGNTATVGGSGLLVNGGTVADPGCSTLDCGLAPMMISGGASTGGGGGGGGGGALVSSIGGCGNGGNSGKLTGTGGIHTVQPV